MIEAVRSHATPELQAALQTLLKNKLLAAPTGEEARRLRETVGRHGNPDRGKDLYLDARSGSAARPVTGWKASAARSAPT